MNDQPVTRATVATGGCQCGAIRYALYAHPKDPHLCHCRMCQKAVGGPFAALGPVQRTMFAWTRGVPTTFASSTVAERSFCNRCGTPLAFAYVDSDWIDVTLGSLDRPADLPPERHYGIEGRLAWIDTIGSLPSSATETSMDLGRQARLVNLQHPDEETADDWRPPASEQR